MPTRLSLSAEKRRLKRRKSLRGSYGIFKGRGSVGEMLNPFRIKQQLTESLGEKAAEAVVGVLSTVYDELAQAVTREDFSQLKATIEDLAEAQRRTEERLGVLTERIDSLTIRIDSLTERVDTLTERMDTLTARVDRLAEAQIETERRLQELIGVVGVVGDLKKQIGGLTMTVGYTLENRALSALPALLSRDYGIAVKDRLRRDWMRIAGFDREVNILGEGTREGSALLIIGESKAQLSRAKIDQFLERRVAPLQAEGRAVFPLVICHMTAEPGVVAYAREHGVAVYLSYEFE